MLEYIERESLVKDIKHYSHARIDNDAIDQMGFQFVEEIISILRIIEKQPTADVVEVVRCKDCKNRRVDEEIINRQKAEIESLRDILYDADGVNLVNYWYQQCKIAENGCRNFEEENENLKAEIERLTAFKSYFDGLYSKGIDVANWHENGELEPFDNFYDDAVKEMVDKNND